MRQVLRFSFLLLITLSAFSPAQKRAIEFTDLFSMGRVDDPQISPDGKWIAYTLTSYDIMENIKNTDIHLVSPDGKSSKPLITHSANDLHPRWSPTDPHVLAFISTRDGAVQVYSVNISSGEERQISTIPTGVNGFAWSPDGKWLALATDMYPEAQTPAESAQMEAELAKRLATGKVIDKLLYRHWDSWRDGKYSRVVVAPVEGGEAKSLTPADADSPPLALGSEHDVAWSPDGKRICFVQNRDRLVAASTNNDLWLSNINGGEVAQITTGKGNDLGPRFSPDGKYIAYLSMPRPGFEADKKNLMLYDLATGQTRNLIENLDRSAEDFVWSPDSRKLYFYAQHHARCRLYEIGVKEGSKPALLLDKTNIGNLQISPDGKFLALQVQRVNLPYELFRLDLGSKKLTQLTFTNRERLAQLEMNPLEDYWFSGANNDSVHLLLLKPPQFDPAKKYPLVSLIHGGPQGAFGDEFHYRWNAQMFASPGYVVIMINFHGSTGYGQAFCDAVSKNWGGWPYQDIMVGTRWAIERFDFIDGERVGAAGASYGGYLINWIAGHNPEGLFKVLVSHDGIFETVSAFGATEELWFPLWEFNGAPWEAGSVYQQWNPVHYANNFNTPTLVIHGEKDYRLPYTQGMQMFTALQMKGVDSRLLLFPDENHFVLKPQNAQLWWKTVLEWLGKYLQP